MTDVYTRLAMRLDTLPNGFPATESGVELKILRKIFTPEDAEMALNLKPLPETAEAMAERLGRPVEALREILDKMAQKGQIGCFKASGHQVYLLMPFVIGIYEFQLDRMDHELAELFAEYRSSLMKALGGTRPALARVVPVNVAIQAQHQVLRYEDMRRIIDEAKSFAVKECICRKQHALEGRPCKHSNEVCLVFSTEEKAYDYFSYGGRVITKEEAFKVLETAKQEGLVHCTYNVQQGHRFVCNCCICCCELLKGIKNIKTPHVLAGSNFQASIDPEICIACGACAEERCMMDAIVEENGAYRVLGERCIGCGVCIVTCPTGSITLERKADADQDTPPKNLVAWSVERSTNRGIRPGG
jgi:Fe-S-cluster-containing hydrogenase component 2